MSERIGKIQEKYSVRGLGSGIYKNSYNLLKREVAWFLNVQKIWTEIHQIRGTTGQEAHTKTFIISCHQGNEN